MSDVKNMHNELNPRLQQMLVAYAITPERDPESVRHTQARFMAELDKIFVAPVASTPATRGAFFSAFDQLSENLARLFAKRSAYFLIIALFILGVYLFSGVGITTYAASSSLPGDKLYSLKTTVEFVRANLTIDSADQARLYMGFAGRRLLEIQSLIRKGRYDDIPRAASEFERDIQKSLSTVKSLSQTNPRQAADLKMEFAPVLRNFSDMLTQMLDGIPRDVQPALQSAINTSKLAVGNDDDDDAGISTPIPTMTATPADVLPTPVPSGSTSVPGPGHGGDENSSEDDGDNGSSNSGNSNDNKGNDDNGGQDDGSGGGGDDDGGDDYDGGGGDDNGGDDDDGGGDDDGGED